MRITPVGIAVPPGRPARRLSSTGWLTASQVTHNTGIALAGAAAVAAAVSAGVSGATVAEATALGVRPPGSRRRRGHWVAGADVAARIEMGRRPGPRARPSERAAEPASTPGRHQPGHPGVGAGRVRGAGRRARRPVAGLPAGRLLGGDCDTIAAMTGAIAGACHGVGSFPPEAIAAIDAQGLGLAALAGELLALRDRHGNEAS